jgi:hypothetical protein
MVLAILVVRCLQIPQLAHLYVVLGHGLAAILGVAVVRSCEWGRVLQCNILVIALIGAAPGS